MRKTFLLFLLAAFTLTAAAQSLKPKQVADARQRIWQSWQQRLSQQARLNLPDQELTDGWHFTWTLPADLEPNADWNYYWGHKGEAAGQPMPLFVYLHGSGPRDMEWKTGYRLAQMFADAPCYYYIPQIPQEGQWYRWYQRSKQWAYERLFTLGFATGRIDPDRVYLFGISEGGYGSQRLASFYADYLAAAGPMAGGEPLKNAPAENCGNIGFSLLTGAKDKGFYRDELTYWTQQAFDSLQVRTPSRYHHRVNLIPGRGHSIDYRLTTPWLSHFRRNAQPRAFDWEDFEMDGRRRDGFYNLQVLQRSTAYRQMYRMLIDGQAIRLTVEDVAYTTTQRDSLFGIEMRFARDFKPSTAGSVRLYLSEELVDLSKPVTVYLNDRKVFHGRLDLDERWMKESLKLFGDPRRIFPAALDFTLAEEK